MNFFKKKNRYPAQGLTNSNGTNPTVHLREFRLKPKFFFYFVWTNPPKLTPVKIEHETLK
jgi:hypothetical protein